MTDRGQKNTSRGFARATHCKNGHEFTPENTSIVDGWRRCIACNRAWKRRRYHERKAAA